MSPQSHCKRQSGAALGGLDVAIAGSSDSVPTCVESAFAGQRPLPGSAEVAEDCFQHLAGKSEHPFSC